MSYSLNHPTGILKVEGINLYLKCLQSLQKLLIGQILMGLICKAVLDDLQSSLNLLILLFYPYICFQLFAG
jgi:hypothetical protein